MTTRRSTTGLARKLRHDSTDAERRIWAYLRDGRLLGLKFRRQHPIGRFIVDFYCHETKLVVEIDGSQHADSGSDQERDAWLRARGIRVLRFWNNEVLTAVDGASEVIRAACVEILGGERDVSPSP